MFPDLYPERVTLQRPGTAGQASAGWASEIAES